MTPTMTPRERLLATVAFEPVDRPFRMETLGFWPETLVRWHSEGLPPEINELVSAHIFSGFDPQLPLYLGADLHPGLDPVFEEEVLEEDARFTIKRDISGSIVKVLTNGISTIPAWLDSPVKDHESWEAIKERMDPDTPGRLEVARALIEFDAERNWPLCAYFTGLFGTHRHLLGFKRLMIAYRRQADLLHEISRHWVKLWKGVFALLAEKRAPDMASLWEDMCYLNGPMISPRVFREFMSPYYRELIDFLKRDLCIPIIGLDTDGKCTELIPLFVEAGVNLLWPFEVQAGMDVLEVRREWPREFAIWGGIDKRALALGREAIDAEVERVVPPMLAKRGYIPSIDHSVPPEVPFADWQYFLEKVRRLGEAPSA
jgi:uroporphyrinogen-III decarboxylase